jgi:hypothetical protein
MLKFLSLSLMLILLAACLPEVPLSPKAAGDNNGGAPEMPILGVQVRVAYIHLNSLTLAEVSSEAVKNQIRELWDRYDVVYMHIDAGEGLRYFDFGTVKIENNMPVKLWTTGDYTTTRKWNYLMSQEPLLEDNHAHDYSWVQNGFSQDFIKAPFAMHYRMKENYLVRFNVIGAHLDSANFNSESEAMTRLIAAAPATFWNTHGTIAFGNFTKNCQNSLGGLIIQNEDETCAEQSVIISEYLQPKVSAVNVIKSADTDFTLLTNKPMIEVFLSL